MHEVMDDLDIIEMLEEFDREDEELIRRLNRYERINSLSRLDDDAFAYKFRLSKSMVEALLVEIMPFIKVTSARNHGVEPLHQLLLTLRFYAMGTLLVSAADFVGVSIATASRIVSSVSAAISSLYPQYIFIQRETYDQFSQIAGFPKVHGVIGGLHVPIQLPSSAIGEEFRNSNGFYSLNVQGVCDANLMFLNMVARWPGSTQDATIFNVSELRAQCEEGILGDRWLLGDSAYPCRPYLLTPLLNPSTDAEHRYNEAHIKTRNIIQRCFRVWKRRFPVLSSKIRLALPNMQNVVTATAVLHNMCRQHNLQDVEPEVEAEESEELGSEQQPVSVGHQDNCARERLINTHFSN